MIKYTNVEQL